MRAPERVGRASWVPGWVRAEHRARYAFAAADVRGQIVVDCACGEGDGAATLREAGARSVDGFDSSEAAIAVASVQHRGDGLRFRVADGLELPVASASVDCYVSFETIEHIADDRAFLAEAARVLTSTGRFICSTPHRLITNPGASLDDHPWNPFHVREYAREELAERLRAAFEHVEFYGQNPVGAFRQQTLRRIGRWSRLGAIWAHRVMKCPQWLTPGLGPHRVERQGSGEREYEYLVAVCSRPRPARAR